MTSSMARPLDAAGDVKLVTICDRKHVEEPYAATCIRSWESIRGVSKPYAMIDTGLGEEGRRIADGFGFEVHGESPEMDEALAGREALREIRRKWLTWRKVVDPVVHFRQHRYVLIIDTDVLITRPIGFPDAGFDFVYSCDPVPAYRGRWHLPLRERMLLSLNAGFLLISPALVDLDELNRLAKTYFLGTRKMWWTAQSVWSVIMAASRRTAMFDGQDVRTIAGNQKQTVEEIMSNRVTLWGRSSLITDVAEMARLTDGAAVLHFASSGKKWIDQVQIANGQDDGVDLVRLVDARRASWLERLIVSGRMLAKSVRDRR